MIVPDGLSIGVNEARELVRVAGRSPSQGRWQMIIVEDADRMSESASNAVLKMIEEPPPRTVVMLCAPSLHPDDVPVTIRSRCRVVALRTPTVTAIADVLVRDGVDPALAAWSAAASGGHVGRARRLARDEEARLARKAVLDVPLRLVSLAACMDAADDLVGSAKEETEAATEVLDGAETDALKNSLGVGARGPGVVAASRGSAGQLKELERRQKSRATRIGRDSLDRALVDLAGLYRDAMVLAAAPEGELPLNHPDRRADAVELSRRLGAGGGAAADRRDPRLPDGAGAERQAADRPGGADRGPATARARAPAPAPDGGGGALVCAGTSAALAQSVEHLTRNEKVVGSIPTGGSPHPAGPSSGAGPLRRSRAVDPSPRTLTAAHLGRGEPPSVRSGTRKGRDRGQWSVLVLGALSEATISASASSRPTQLAPSTDLPGSRSL